GGAFLSIGPQPRSYIAALDATTGNPTTWNPGTSYVVNALVASGNSVFAGGNSGVTAVDRTSSSSLWNTPAAYVYALAISVTTLYVGGQFTYLGAQARSAIGALDATSGGVTSWNPTAQIFGGAQVHALTVSADGTIVYVGGYFVTIGGQSRNHIA